MKKLLFLAGVLLITSAITAQVGIGTLTPNTKSVLELSSSSKGLLLPRMSSAEKANMSLTSADAGMMVYQTTSPKGPYTWDGTNWINYAPGDAGVTTGSTIRWDGSKWAAVTNLFNQGSSIGIGTQNPNTQLQIHSNSIPTTRLQITNATTGALSTDGLLLGVTLANGSAHLLQQENRYLSFGTNNLERVRIDSLGRVGIGTTNPNSILQLQGNSGTQGQLLITNAATASSSTDGLLIGCNDQGIAQVNQQENRSLILATNGVEKIRLDSIGRFGINTVNPSATLDVNGTFKLGTNGSSLQSIMKVSYQTDPPEIGAFAEWNCNISCPGSTTDAVVYVSPDTNLDHIIIGYSRVTVAGNIQVKFMNMSTSPINLGTVNLNVAVIQ